MSVSMFTITVHPWQRALERRPGEPTHVLAPGRHRRRRRATYTWLDDRQRMDHTAPQEVLTADGVTVKVTAVVRWRIGDPVRFTEVVADPFGSVYLAVQLALRDAVTSLDADSVARSARSDVGAVALRAATVAGDAAGVEVLEVVVKDVVLPGELRAAYAEVVTGRQRALAQLEAARAETAALRSLANGAKLLDDHPALAQLRLVQALPIGSTVELTTGATKRD
jgi:regulator of protease activity HflC (stomatin/prohibitin superfamily)